MTELHKDDIQLLLMVLAHGFKFCVVAVFLFPSLFFCSLTSDRNSDFFF